MAGDEISTMDGNCPIKSIVTITRIGDVRKLVLRRYIWQHYTYEEL